MDSELLSFQFERLIEVLKRIACALEAPLREAEAVADVISNVNRELDGYELDKPKPVVRLEVEGQ